MCSFVCKYVGQTDGQIGGRTDSQSRSGHDLTGGAGLQDMLTDRPTDRQSYLDSDCYCDCE